MNVSLAHADFVPIGGGLRAYYAAPAAVKAPALLLFQEAFGVNDHIQDVCRRFAARGYATISPDFYRGATFSYGGEDAEARKKAAFDDTFALRAMRDALAYLDGRDGAGATSVGAIGYCMGGRLAFLAAEALADRIAAAVSYYGGGIAEARDAGRPSLLSGVQAIRAPLQLVYGAEDGNIGPEEHGRVAMALSGAKKRYTLDVYAGAGHGFFCDQRPSYDPDAAQAAWESTLRFFADHLH